MGNQKTIYRQRLKCTWEILSYHRSIAENSRRVSYGQAFLRRLLVLKVGGEVGHTHTHKHYDLPKTITSKFSRLMHPAG